MVSCSITILPLARRAIPMPQMRKVELTRFPRFSTGFAMNLRSVSTTRKYFYAILILATLLGSFINFARTAKLHKDYLKGSNYCQRVSKQYENYATEFNDQYKTFLSNPNAKPQLRFLSLAPTNGEKQFTMESVSQNRRLAEKFLRTRQIFDYAASHPWEDFFGWKRSDSRDQILINSLRSQIDCHSSADEQY
jgi:hypothetical protein